MGRKMVRKFNKVWVVGLLTVLAVVVFGINVYPKVVIDNIVEVEKLYRSDVLEDSFPAYVKSESDPEDGWVLLGYMTINCEGDHSYFGPLSEGEYKVEAWAGAINHWTDEPRAGWTWYPWPYDYLSVNGQRFKIGPWFWTQAEAEAYWKGDYIILDIPQGGYIDGYWRDPDYSDNAGSCTVAIYGREVVDYIKAFPDPAYVLVEKELQFVAKGYGYGENGEKDGDPDPVTYEPAGDDTGPVDVEVSWTTSVPPEVGVIGECCGLFTAGTTAGSGTVTATTLCAKSDSADITVVPSIDKVTVEPKKATVLVGKTQGFEAKGIYFGPDREEGTDDDVGPFPVNAKWTIGAQEIGSVAPDKGTATTFTAVSGLPEKKKKLVGQVIATVGEEQGHTVVTVILFEVIITGVSVDAGGTSETEVHYQYTLTSDVDKLFFELRSSSGKVIVFKSKNNVSAGEHQYSFDQDKFLDDDGYIEKGKWKFYITAQIIEPFCLASDYKSIKVKKAKPKKAKLMANIWTVSPAGVPYATASLDADIIVAYYELKYSLGGTSNYLDDGRIHMKMYDDLFPPPPVTVDNIKVTVIIKSGNLIVAQEENPGKDKIEESEAKYDIWGVWSKKPSEFVTRFATVGIFHGKVIPDEKIISY